MRVVSGNHAGRYRRRFLGVTKPFIYTHFRVKVELLAALCKPTIELSLDAVTNAATRPGTPTERLRHAITDFTKAVLHRQPNIAIYFREEKEPSPEALAEINALRRQFDHVPSDPAGGGYGCG